MKALTLTTCACLMSGMALAAPRVANVSFAQTADRLVTVTYDLLDEDAIVTVDIQTNVTGTAEGDAYASIGGANIRCVTGDSNKFVAAGNGRKLYWQADKSWEGHVFKEPMVRAVVTARAKNSPPDYMVVELNDYGAEKNSGEFLRFYDSEDHLPEGIASDIYRTEKIVMRRIPAAGKEFVMGSPEGEYQRSAANEYPIKVLFTNDWFMSVFELTQMQYCRAMTNDVAKYSTVNKSTWKTETNWQVLPMSNTSCADDRGVVNKGWNWPTNGHDVDPASTMGRLRAVTGIDFDLPTEPQWEFCCRAGTTGPNYNGAIITSTSATETWRLLSDIAWYSGNSGNKPHRVGELKANDFGLYDMLGNMAERTADWYRVDCRDAGLTQVDPQGPEYGTGVTEHSRRGSYYGWNACYARAAKRNSNGHGTAQDYIGIRLICPLTLKW